MEELSNREKHVLGPGQPPITKAEFREKLWSLRPHGNIEDAYIWACHIVKNVKDFDGNPITLDDLAESFSTYLSMRKREGTESRYIKSLKSFLEGGGYNNKDEGPDDIYLKYADPE